MGASRAVRLFYIVSLFPMRSLHQDRLGVGAESTWPTVSCFLLAILYSYGYCCLKGVLPSQMSSQNLTCDPFFIMKVPNRRNSFFAFSKLAQKWESPLFHWTWTNDLVRRYLLRRIFCQVPSVVNYRYNHLLSNAMFLSSRFCIPKPPCSLGCHRISHFASRYFRLCSSLCQKNRDRK